MDRQRLCAVGLIERLGGLDEGERGINSGHGMRVYVGILAAVAGQPLVVGRPVLWVYLVAVFAMFFSFVRFYEQPKLTKTFGDEYVQYCRAVPAWIPRLRPYRGAT